MGAVQQPDGPMTQSPRRSSVVRSVTALAAALVVSGCMGNAGAPQNAMPVMRWDHHPEASEWTEATLDALKAEGAVLLASDPQGIEQFCPGYDTASQAERAAFWSGMFSALAKYESSWNPGASGGGGRYLGLMQISPATARQAGCDTSDGLKDGATNLACAVKIAARRAPDAHAMQGILGDWGPMQDASKRAEMAAWTRNQSYCTAG